MNPDMQERSADVLEEASELQLRFNNKGVAAAQAANAPQSDPAYDGEHCIECSSTIPKVRRDMGRIRCVPCQEDIEKTQRRFR